MRTRIVRHVAFVAVIVLLNCIVVSDYFFHGTKAANFDAVAHITTIAQFHKALSDGEFPVAWGDGFANYGLPLGTIAHQLPAYTGALMTFVTHDPLMSFNIVYLISAIASAVLLYIFLTRYLSAESSLLAVIFFSLAPYRIMNLYMRGAMPEFASAVWVPVLLLGVWGVAKRETVRWYVLVGIGALGLILTHPMMLVVYAPVVGIYAVLQFGRSWKRWRGVVIAGIVAVGISAYYFLPLNLEMKYLYYGGMSSHYSRNQTTTRDSFFNPFWKYNCVYRNDIFGRCQLPKGGVTETVIMIIATGFGLCVLLRARHLHSIFARIRDLGEKMLHGDATKLYIFTIVGGVVSVLCSTALFQPLYERFNVLGSIQYPWRFLSSYLFFPPIALGLMYDAWKHHKIVPYLWYILVIGIIILRFPQLYGKNYTYVPQSEYYFTPYNLHSLTMNTIWSGDSGDYPPMRDKAHIIEGKGSIISRTIWNAKRDYVIQSDTGVNVSDNTFYFPGWKVYVDGKDTPIEFQDPAYRGVITFRVPSGRHKVIVVYEDTKVRAMGKAISVLTVAVVVLCALGRYLLLHRGVRLRHVA